MTITWNMSYTPSCLTSDLTLHGILLVFFSRESWNENLRLSDTASEKTVKTLTEKLKPFRNVAFQVWNEFNYRAIDYAKIIKTADTERLVAKSPGYGGDLGSPAENRK